MYNRNMNDQYRNRDQRKIPQKSVNNNSDRKESSAERARRISEERHREDLRKKGIMI